MTGERRQGAVRAWALGLAIAAVAMLAVLPSAAAKSNGPAGAQSLGNMSTPEIRSYLRSLGVNTRGLVIQRGERNYAGPSCPGRAWNCTTSTRVVQVSQRQAIAGDDDDDDDDENRFVCRRVRGPGSQTTDASPPVQSCEIMQGAASSNSATCEISTTSSGAHISQTCLITQGGTSNTAVAKLTAVLRGTATTQDVDQRIEILQTGGGSGNTITASETARLQRGGGGDDDDDDDDDDYRASGLDVSMSQDFHQVVCTNQQAAGSGRNSANVTQNGRATIDLERAGNVDVAQNTDQVESTCRPGGPAAPFADIAGAGHNNTLCPIESDDFGFAKQNANTCARVQQDSGTGRNSIEQRQSSLLDVEVDRADAVEIDQGSLLGGIDSTQDQESGGVSRNEDRQDADQLVSVRRADSFDVNQIEDPRCCANGHQLGNTGNSWSLAQDLLQRTLIDGKRVDPEDVEGGSVTQQGANFGNCTSSGACTVTQRLQNNVETETNSCTGTSCDIFTDCVAAGGEGGSGLCTTEDDVEISNTASVSSETPDPNSENNSDTETTLVLAGGGVSVTHARQLAPQAITPTTDAEALAGAIAAQEGVVTSAVFADVVQTETIVPHAVSDTELAGFPTHGETYAILTTGDASLVATEGGFADAQLGGGNVRGDTDLDVAVLQVDLDVPAGFSCLSFDFRFLSEEYPDFVGQTFNDAFIAELDNSTWTTSGSTITADDNFAFDPSGDVISINSTGVANMTAEAAAGTVYGGATGPLRASTPIAPGVHSLFLSIFDQGDMRYDSAVFLDNLVLGTQVGEDCEEGVTPVAEADLSVALSDSPDPVDEGGLLTYTVTVSNEGPDEAEGVTLIDNLPALLDFGSAVPSQGSCTQVLAVSCDLGAIAPEGSVTVTITATP